MKKLVANLAAVLFLASLSLGASKAKTLTGEIMDSQCAMMGSHAKMEEMHYMGNDSKMCSLQCVKMGGKFVLYNAAEKATYPLDDQEKPREFAGQKVKVTGTYDKASKTVHVEKIQAI